jgi:DNA mismatch repair protein MutL
VCAHNTGTSIEVCDLFYNVPARQKFLKKKETEWNQIHHFLQAFCVSNCTIDLTVFHGAQRALHCPSVSSVRDRCAQIWSPAIVQDLITLDPHHVSECVSIEGVVSNHQYARYDRSGIFFFVNKRWVQNTPLSRALIKAYQNVLPQGRYPIAAIFITIDPYEIDINIHPKKEEVSFLHPRIIEAAIQESVKKALAGQLGDVFKKPVQLTAGLLPDGSIQRMHSYTSYQAAAQALSRPQFPAEHFSPLHAQNRSLDFMDGNSSECSKQLNESRTLSFSRESSHVGEQPVSAYEHIYEQAVFSTAEQPKIIGQYATTYILVEHAEGLYMIDQHAAHERILYASFATSTASHTTVPLIIPQIVTVARDQLMKLEPHLALLYSNGFEVVVSGVDQLTVSSTPVYAKNISLPELVQQLVSWIGEYQSYTAQEFESVIQHHMRAQMACKAAVKAGDNLSHAEMVELIEKLEKTPDKLTCPHGRPTGWLMSLYEIEKKFKRKT